MRTIQVGGRAARAACLAHLLAAWVVAWAPGRARAAISVTETNDQDSVINIAECSNAEADGLAFSWSISSFSAAGTYTLLASDQSGCPTGSDSTAHNLTIADGVTASSASGSYPSSGSVAVATLLNALQISCTSSATAVFFCVNYTTNGTVTTGAATGSFALDLERPPPPTVYAPTPGDSGLHVDWTAGSGSSDAGTLGTSSSYEVVVTSEADASDVHEKTVTSGTSTRVDGLVNGTTYDVVVYALTSGGNRSDTSNTVVGTPTYVEDFWRLYESAGGHEPGGCGAGGAGLLTLAALLPWTARRLRRRP